MTIEVKITHCDPTVDKDIEITLFDEVENSIGTVDRLHDRVMLKPGETWTGYLWNDRSIRIHEKERYTPKRQSSSIQYGIPDEPVPSLQ